MVLGIGNILSIEIKKFLRLTRTWQPQEIKADRCGLSIGTWEREADYDPGELD